MALIPVFIFLLWIALHIALHSRAMVKPYAIAHRGGSGLAPENTLAAISKSIDMGIKIVEADVQRTSDKVLVLLHDRSVERTTGSSGNISELTWEKVSQLDAGSYFSGRFTGESIPTLDNVLKVITENDITLFLEVKNPSDYPGIENQILYALNKYQAEKNVVIISFDHKWLQILRKAASDIRIGLLCYCKGSMPENSTANYLGVYWPAVIFDPTLIVRAHKAGLNVFVWSVNSGPGMRIMHWLGADGIVTDRPDILMDIAESF